MILKLGLEYWRLKTVPLSRFIYNTLLESSLKKKHKKKTDKQQINKYSNMKKIK